MQVSEDKVAELGLDLNWNSFALTINSFLKLITLCICQAESGFFSVFRPC